MKKPHRIYVITDDIGENKEFDEANCEAAEARGRKWRRAEAAAREMEEQGEVDRRALGALLMREGDMA